jgi:penicillin G amidase
MAGFLDELRSQAAEALFPVEGELRVEGLGDTATIRRSPWGAAQIEAASLDDLWFAQGMVTAGERLFQLELAIRAGTGRLSEIFGERTVPADRFARTIGLHLAGEAYVAGWTDEDHAMHARFRAGVRAWVEQMPTPPLEYRLFDLEPWLPDDAATWASCIAYLAWGLSNNHDQELLRAWIHERAGAEAVGTLLPPLPSGDPPATIAGGLHGELLDALPHPKGQGSNAWVVDGSRTASGNPLLANDPHLLALQPSPWFEMDLRAPGYQARGVALTFLPGVVIGATPHHAWGITNVSGDVQDLYVERLSEDGTAAVFRDGWEPLTAREEAITVRGEAAPRAHSVRETRHGPILDAHEHGLVSTTYPPTPTDRVYALRWVGRTHGLRPTLTLHAARAADFSAFRKVALEVECPGQNFVYADVDGTIGYQCSGHHPVRARGDGTAPVPGWDGEHEWLGWVPPDELPWAENPSQGFLVSANHRMHPEDYPHLLSEDFHEPYRARRIAELLEARDDHDVASMAAIQVDTVSLPGRRLVPLLLDRIGVPRDDRRRRALDLVGSWDGDMAAGSGAAAVVNAWSVHVVRRALGPWLGDDLAQAYLAWRERWCCSALPSMLEANDPRLDADLLADALDDALDELAQRLGDDPEEWSWGALHTVRLSHPLAAIPGLEPLFTAAELPVGGDEQTVAQFGIDGTLGYAAAVIPSWRAVYDLADLEASVGTLPTGNSGNPASPHWNDQVEDYATGVHHRLASAPHDGTDRDTAWRTLRLTP